MPDRPTLPLLVPADPAEGYSLHRRFRTTSRAACADQKVAQGQQIRVRHEDIAYVYGRVPTARAVDPDHVVFEKGEARGVARLVKEHVVNIRRPKAAAMSGRHGQTNAAEIPQQQRRRTE